MKINPNEILAALGPSSPPGLIFNIFLYLIFILALIAMFMQDDKQLIATLLIGSVAAMAVIAKLNVFKPHDLGSLVTNAWIFVIPLITAGLTKAKKTIPLFMFGGLLGGIYFFAFWFFMQNG